MKEALVNRGISLLDQACEANRHRDAEIMQGIDGEKEHALAVLSWVRKINPNPSPELEASAIFHDVDRIVTPGVGGGFKGDRNSPEYEEHKKAHARRSAAYITPLIAQEGLPQDSVDRINFLITHHDDTGKEVESFNDNDLNTLVAADSFAFFTSIAPKLYAAEGEARLKDKVRFMVEKMPQFARNMLAEQTLDNEVFERVKNQALSDLKQSE